MNFAGMPITQIRDYVANLDDVPDELIATLLQDHRKGVVALAEQLEARKKQQAKTQEKWQEMTRIEMTQRGLGKTYIAGIDEVGRGPLAGPVVACAVILPDDFYLPGLDDSKKVPSSTREAFYEIIVRDAVSIGIGVISAERIDEINILEATREAMRHAVEELHVKPDICLIDAVHIPEFPCEQLPIIGGDAKSVSIAAASIVAKVTRDRLMAEYGKLYPEYLFEKNAGYGTGEHLEALRKWGPTPIHRRTFGGVKELLLQG